MATKLEGVGGGGLGGMATKKKLFAASLLITVSITVFEIVYVSNIRW